MPLVQTQAFDPTAWRQDFTRQGHLAQTPLRGNGVPVPFEIFQTFLEAIGSATVQYQTGGQIANEDGSNTGIFVTVPAFSGTQNGGRIWVRFVGSIFGVRYLLPAGGSPAFSCKVDGRAYKIGAQDNFLTAEQRTFADGTAGQFLVQGLSPYRQHRAVLTFPSPLTGSYSISVLGLTLDEFAGYATPPRCQGVLSSANLTTTLTNVNLGSSSASGRGFSSIGFSNNDVSSVSVLTCTGAAGSGVATGTVASTVGMFVGAPIVIAGAVPAEYNGLFTIASVISATQFTYNFASSTTTTATGTVTAAWKNHFVRVNYNGNDEWTETLGPRGKATFSPTTLRSIKLAGTAANFQVAADAAAAVLCTVIG